MNKDDRKRKEPKQAAARPATRPQLTWSILADVANARDVLEGIRTEDGKEVVERGIKKATEILESILARV
jgi:hypothetical protein